MSNIIRSVFSFSILILLILCVACTTQSTAVSAPADPVTSPAGKKSQSLALVSTYTMPPSEGGLTVRFAFTPNHRLWSRGSSDSKKNQMMYSDDFSKSWNFVDLPNRGIGGDGTILFVDQKHGWAIDTDDVLNTEDGGMTWAQVTLPKKSKIITLNSIHFRDVNRGFIAGSITYKAAPGDPQEYGMEILCTGNGGESWTICYNSKENDTTWRILSIGNATMLLVDQKTLLVTNDNGATWKEKRWEFPAMDIESDSNGVLWTVGEDNLIRSSRDLGDTWETIPLKYPFDPEFSWNSISFDDSGLGVAVGDDGLVALTADHGKSWDLQSQLNLKNDLATVRVQAPYVAISDSRNLTVFCVD